MLIGLIQCCPSETGILHNGECCFRVQDGQVAELLQLPIVQYNIIIFLGLGLSLIGFIDLDGGLILEFAALSTDSILELLLLYQIVSQGTTVDKL